MMLDNSRCPFCDDDPFFAWEIYGNSPYAPACCEAAAATIEAEGAAAFYGRSYTALFRDEFGLPLRRIDVGDIGRPSCAVFPLVVHNPGPGTRGWQSDVFADIDEHHSHHDAPVGWKFGIAVSNGFTRVGVAVVGRPVARMIATRDDSVLEVTRVCCWGDPRLRHNAASKLYGACRREAKRRGYSRLITYTLVSEDGASCKAANFTPTHISEGGGWSRPSRRRTNSAPTCEKVRWELGLDRQARRNIARREIDLDRYLNHIRNRPEQLQLLA
jgi:hypothetical protein